jgi:dCTP deaminase
MCRGTFTDADIQALVEQGQIRSEQPLATGQVQPASLDLRLGAEAWRMPGSTLPREHESIRDLIDCLALERLDLNTATCLARGCVYLIRLQEAVALPSGVEAYCNAKSSTGRIDVATRVLCDGNARYDRIAAGYRGELWLEVTSRSFDVVLQADCCLNQAIFFRQRRLLDQAALQQEHALQSLLLDEQGVVNSGINDGRLILRAHLDRPVVGYVARRSHRPIDLRPGQRHDSRHYFTAIPQPDSGYLFLEKDRFYILASRERLVVPPHLACEMVPYDPAAGEFRAHYAGFFDPGFGIHTDGAQGTRAVLEVRPHEDDLILRDGQPIGAMVYERLTAPCHRQYGHGSHYAVQNGPRLSKYFD